MPETCRFSTSIFRKFGLDLGGPWVSKMEPSWPCWPPKTSEQLFFYPLKLQVFKKWCLGRLQARFWRLRGSVLEGLGMIFKTFASFLARCLEDVSSSTPSNDLSHAGRAETSKKAKNLPKSCHGACWPCWPSKPSEQLFFYPLKLQVFRKWRLGRLQARWLRRRFLQYSLQ